MISIVIDRSALNRGGRGGKARWGNRKETYSGVYSSDSSGEGAAMLLL